MESRNPATGELLESYDKHDKDDILDILEASQNRYNSWKNRNLQEREELLSNAATVLRDNKEKYAKIMTKEMGKPILQSRSEVEKCAWVCDHYAENAGNYLQDDVHPSPPGTDVRTKYEPLGPVLAVMPWNYPFWQVFRFAAPYLTVGNVGLLKHASNVPQSALAIEEVFEKAGYPDNTFKTVLAPVEHVKTMLTDNRVKATTLTGSGAAGSSVGEIAGCQIKKSVLELGGSDPYIVLSDADVDQAAETGTLARNQNGGQSCIAAKRFIIVEDVYDEFIEKLKLNFEDLKIGDPMDEDTNIGPQADENLMNEMHSQVKTSIDAGADVLTGGEILDREGYYYPPTILTDVPRGCPVDQNEIFGPVAAVYKVKNKKEAIEKANDTDYGLGASVWSNNTTEAREVASQINSGCVYINELVKSDPRVPFGGIEISGYGRELSEVGIKEFTNKKTIWVDESQSTEDN